MTVRRHITPRFKRESAALGIPISHQEPRDIHAQLSAVLSSLWRARHDKDWTGVAHAESDLALILMQHQEATCSH